MNWYGIPHLLVSILVVCFGGFIFLKDRKSAYNRFFLLLCTSLFIYYFFYSLVYLFPSKFTIYYFTRIGHIGAIFVAPFYYQFTAKYLDLKKGSIFIKIIYLYCFLLSILIFTSSFYFADITERFWGYYPKGGPLALLDHLVHLAIVIRCTLLYISKYKEYRSSNNFVDYNRLKYLALSFGIFVFLSVDYIPKFFHNVYPFGFIFVIAFILLNSYAIVKHRLLDINIVFRKGLIYSILVTIITVAYFVLVFLSENLFRDFIGYKSPFLTLFIIISFILLFQPLKNRVQYMVDRLFFKRSIDQIEQENILLREELQRSEKLKAVGTLAAGMAHEIKNPLTSIKTFTEYLPKKYRDKSFIDKFQKIVGSEVDKINNIVAQLLDFSKPKPLELKHYDLQEILDETLELLSNDFIKYKIIISKNYKNKKAVLAMDITKIKQVVLNIILNAIESMKDKGGELNISLREEGAGYKIEIADTGCGIDQKNLPHLFDPFYSTKDTNTGLGLSIVHSITEKHHGKIDVKSELGKGTKFTIYLPRTSP